MFFGECAKDRPFSKVSTVFPKQVQDPFLHFAVGVQQQAVFPLVKIKFCFHDQVAELPDQPVTDGG